MIKGLPYNKEVYKKFSVFNHKSINKLKNLLIYTRLYKL